MTNEELDALEAVCGDILTPWIRRANIASNAVPRLIAELRASMEREAARDTCSCGATHDGSDT